MLAKAVAVALLTTAAFAASPSEYASAGFNATAIGAALAPVQSIPASVPPVAVATGREVAVSWSVTTLTGGTSAESYTVRRFDTSDVAQVVLTGCDVVTTASCVENNVPIGTWTYSVQAHIGSWTGAEGPKSAPITVAPSSLILDSTAPILSLPASVTGTIANFLVAETLTYRLDSAVGPVLSGSPSTVTSSTSMAVSVTVPAGTSDAPHSVFVVGSGGSFAAAAIDIVFPPLLQSMQMRDVNGNGKVDQVTVVFDDTLAAYTAGIAPWTLANVPSGGTLASVIVAGNTATLTIAEGLAAANTAVGTFTVALAADPTGVRDAYAHQSSFAATAPTDVAAPALITLTTLDTTGVSGKVDRVTALFSEPLQAYSATNTPWTLTGVPSGGILASVAGAAATLTLTLTEGGGAADTTVGAMTVAMASHANGARDAFGNLSTFTARTPLDGVAPIRQSSEMFDDNVDGKIDRVLVTFSETLAPFTAPVTVFTMASAPSGATINNVTTSGTQATLALDQGTGAATTAVGSFTTALATNANGIRDAANNQSSYTATAPTDRAAPALLTLTMLDNDTDGRVDRVNALFSETLLAYSAGTTPWTLPNIPSGGALSAVTVITGTTLRLAVTEGTGAVDTGVGAMTVAMAANGGGARDAAGNQSSFTARAPLDGARPLAVGITDTGGSTNGRAQSGDTISITFSEPLLPTSVPATTTVTLTDPNTTGNDTLTMAGISNGLRDMGSNAYVTNNNTAAAFANSAVTRSNGDRTVTVTIGAACAGTGCAGLATQATNAAYLYAPPTTLTDVAANLTLTTAITYSARLF